MSLVLVDELVGLEVRLLPPLEEVVSATLEAPPGPEPVMREAGVL